jgi:hypothetical protein
VGIVHDWKGIKKTNDAAAVQTPRKKVIGIGMGGAHKQQCTERI